MSSDTNDSADDNPKALVVALAGTAFLGVIAYGLSIVANTPLAPQFHWSVMDAAIGLAGAAPLAVLLWWFMATPRPTLARFRQSQIEFFAQVGFRFTPMRILLMALFAGIFEELLFRGVLQTAAAKITPMVIAILLSNLIFGAVHWRTALYALIAGLVGVWIGVLFALTGNLLTPIITHAVYDLVALVVTARAIDAWRASKMHAGADTVD